MKNITALAAAGIAVVTVGSALTGCSPTTEQPYTGPPVPPPTVWTGSPAPAHSEGHGGHNQASEAAPESPAEGADLHQYIVDNKISELPIRKGEPGTPTFEFPFPPDWRPAGDRKPDWAYGAIIYDKAKDPSDPPYMYAIASKLTGNVEPQKVLDLAPGQLSQLPGFKAFGGPPERVKFSGYDSVNYAGTYMWQGKQRSVGQQTVVIPGSDGLFVLQLNAEGPGGQERVVIDAADLIRAQTKITLPS